MFKTSNILNTVFFFCKDSMVRNGVFCHFMQFYNFSFPYRYGPSMYMKWCWVRVQRVYDMYGVCLDYVCNARTLYTVCI